MSWAAFYFIASIATVFFSHGGVKRLGRKQHIIGAHALFWSWVASWLARRLTETVAPVEYYAGIDIVMLAVFGYLMISRRAIWACVCVLLHTAMAFAHFGYLFRSIGRTDYLLSTNILFLLSLLTVNTAIIVGRNAWGARIDAGLSRRLWRYTWSGLVSPRADDPRLPLA